MLNITPKNCLKGFVFTCAFAIATSAFAAKKEAPLDLSILEHRDFFAQMMDSSERITLRKLEAAIEKSKSDIQSAEYLVNTKPSAFRDANEVKTIVKNGEKLLKAAEIELQQTQRELIAHLGTIQTKHKAQQEAASKKFGFDLESTTYEVALQSSVSAALETARNTGYKTVVYSAAFVTNENETNKYSVEARNEIYDQLVEIDGTNFQISLNLDLKLDDNAQFTFGNIDSFADDKLALLAIELIESDQDSGHLCVRLLDLYSFQIIDMALAHVTEIPELNEIAIDSETAEEENTAEVDDSTPIAIGAEIVDKGMWIDRLASQEYNFKVSADIDAPLIPSLLLMHTIVENTSMKVIDEAFVNRAYGSESIEATAEAGAELKISSGEETLTISALSYSNDRTLEIGSMQLKFK
ncbi:MAG: hypothetical protein ACSHYA_01775 [Opitutaceae bacterium]